MSLKPALSSEEFLKLTGLNKAIADSCIGKFNNSPIVALASFTQSYDSIEKSYYDSVDAPKRHGTVINNHLRVLYEYLEETMKREKCSQEAAWKMIHKLEPSVHTSGLTEEKDTVNPSAFSFNSTLNPTQDPHKSSPFSGLERTLPTETPKKEPSKMNPFVGGFQSGAPSSIPSGNFTFGSSTTTEKAANFGFNSPYGTAVKQGFTFGPKTESIATKPAAPQVPQMPPAIIANPTYSTGSFMDLPTFWEDEVIPKATLFNLDRGYLAANRPNIRARLIKWHEKAGSFYQNSVQYVPIVDRDENYARVIIKDAERTFLKNENREKFAEFLHSMFHEFKSYGQAMSHVAGILLLGLTEEEAAAVLRKMKQYIPGHWAHEAVGFATNAWVFDYILQEEHPDVSKHFNLLNLWPDTYLQKIMSSLCVHVMPFKLLFDFLESFIEEGFPFLIKFLLSLIEHFKAEILAIGASGINEIYNLMRLDLSTVEVSDQEIILQRSKKVDVSHYDIDALRTKAYDEKIGPRLALAPKEETFEPCTKCEKNKPTWYSDTHGIACDECKGEQGGDWEKY